jgi:transposase
MGFCRPYLTLLPKDAGQRRYPLREVFNGLRYLIKSGTPWRMIPHDLPPWIMVNQQTRRWPEAGVFDALVADLRLLLRLQVGRAGTAQRRDPGQPHAAVAPREWGASWV